MKRTLLSFLGVSALCAMLAAAAHAAEIDYSAVYGGVLDGFYRLMSDDSGEPVEIEGETGVREAAAGLEDRGAILDRVGYAIRDFSGDGISELLIGGISEADGSACCGDKVYAVYTCAGGAPRFVFEGYARSAYRAMGAGKFFYRGSGGAAYSMFGTYALSRDGTSLVCGDYYFTFPKDERFEKLGFYHNTSGRLDKAASRELKISAEKFWQLQAKLEKQTRDVVLTPFSEYKPARENAPAADRAGPLVRAQWAKDAPTGISVCGEFVASSSEPQAKILFSTDRAVKDFKVLALAFESVDENGKVSFAVKELYRLDQLTPEHPLAVVTTFFGDLPNNGVSYVGEDGATRNFAVNVSGEDGSLMLTEF